MLLKWKQKKQKYNTVGTVPKYNTVGTVPKCNTVGTVPKVQHCRNSSQNTILSEQFQKYNRKIIEPESKSILLTHIIQFSFLIRFFFKYLISYIFGIGQIYLFIGNIYLCLITFNWFRPKIHIKTECPSGSMS